MIARGGYTKQDILDALHGKKHPVNMRFKYHLLDKDERFKKVLTSVLGGEVQVQALSTIKRTARFEMIEDEDIDWLSDRIQPFCEVKMGEVKRKHDDYTLAFDGVDDYVDCGNSDVLSTDNALSISVWYYATSDEVSGIVVKGQSGVWAGNEYGLRGTGVGELGFYISDVNDVDVNTLRFPMALNEWVHITAVTSVELGKLQVYINGELYNEIPRTVMMGNKGKSVYVGKGYSSTFWEGKINDLAIYNRALTQEEIQANMNKRLTGNEQGLVGLWRFNEGTGNIAKDSTPNGNDGTIYGAQYEKVGIEVETIPSQYISFPLGVFLLSSPTRQDSDNTVTRDVEAYDGLIVLKEDKFKNRYTVSAGTNYVEAVIQILQSAGITKWNIEQTDKVLDKDIDFKPGREKLYAINDLLRQINYDGIKVDVNGYYTSAYYRSPSIRTAEYTYTDDEYSVTLPGMQEEFDLTSVPNEFVVVRSNPEQPPIKSVYVNDNPDSPTSTVSRGREITDFRKVDDIADQEALDSYTQRIAHEASQVYGRIRFQTGIIPFHDIDDVVNIHYSKLGIEAKYSEVGWRFPLQAGGIMSHELRRVVNV